MADLAFSHGQSTAHLVAVFDLGGRGVRDHGQQNPSLELEILAIR